MEFSRTHFEVLGLGLESQVLGLGLEASSPRKLPCPRLEDSTIFWIVKILQIAWRICLNTFFFLFFFWGRLKIYFEDRFFFFFFFFGEHLRLCPWSLASSIPVLSVERVCPRKGCPWPRPRIFCVLGLVWPRALCPRLHLCFKSSKIPCPRSRTALFFDLLKMGQPFFFFVRNFAEILRFSRRPFFGDHCLARCNLGPWPRAFLSLVSRASVLSKSVLGLGFFLCPWPRALCPRLHLC